VNRLTIVCLACVLVFVTLGAVQAPTPATAVVPQNARPLPLSDVRLTGGPLKHAQDMNGKYLLSLQPDRMMAFLRRAAGLAPKADGYGGWDGDGRQLTGHIAGHYLSGVSLMWAATGDVRFKDRASYLVNELKAVQDAQGDGYIGAQADRNNVPGKKLYEQLSEGVIKSGGFDLNGMWSPWYVEHKIYAGLRDAYRFAGNRSALDVEIRFAAWAERILSRLSDEQIQQMLATEFGGMNEVMVDLYADTGDRRWLAVAERFQHRAIVDPLARREDILQGKHGNTQVPKMLGSLERYVYAGSQPDGVAASFFWDEVALHHSFATGGHGRNEYFGAPDQLNDMIQGRTAETCNVYNMIKMARRLFALDPQIRYAEFHERALYNHILGSIDPQDGATCYMVPVGQGVSREYQDMEHDFTCCVGSGMESHALHADGIYYENGDTLWVNLYAPTVATWKAAGITVTTATTFPDGGDVSMTIGAVHPKTFTLALRRPSWAGAGFSMKVNGVLVKDLPAAGSYVNVTRVWKGGDRVELVLPKTLRLEPLADNPERAAVLWGPLVLAGDLGPEPQRGPEGEDARTPEQRPVTPVLVTANPDVSTWVTPVAGKPGWFRTEGVGRDRDVELVPFYQLHRRTYSAYFDVLTPDRWQQRAASLLAEREAQRALEAATVAFAQPGQMQTERDFNQTGGNSSPVQYMGRYGRRAVDWFAFDLPVDPASRMSLVVTYNREERANRTFDVLVDGVKIGEQSIKRRVPQEKEEFFDVTYRLPAEVAAGKKKVTVRFQGTNGSETGTVYGIRVVRN
jgi:DUF1680 family protein